MSKNLFLEHTTSNNANITKTKVAYRNNLDNTQTVFVIEQPARRCFSIYSSSIRIAHMI